MSGIMNFESSNSHQVALKQWIDPDGATVNNGGGLRLPYYVIDVPIAHLSWEKRKNEVSRDFNRAIWLVH